MSTLSTQVPVQHVWYRRLRRLSLGLGLLCLVSCAPEDQQETPGDQGHADLSVVGLVRPATLATESSGTVLVADTDLSSIVRVAPRSGEITMVSGPGTGSGTPLRAPRALALMNDGTAMVVDHATATVLRVDPQSGEREAVSGCSAFDFTTYICLATRGDGPLFNTPLAIATEPRGALLLLHSGPDVVLRIDPSSGDRQLVSGCPQPHRLFEECPDTPVGTGPLWQEPTALAVKEDGMFVVTDALLPAVIKVNPDTGERTVVAGCPHRTEDDNTCPEAPVGHCPLLMSPRAVTVQPDGTLALLDGTSVLAMDPETGACTVISSNDTGSGPLLDVPEALTMGADGTFLITDTTLRALLRVEPGSGARTLIAAGATVGSGPRVHFLYGMAPLTADEVVVADTQGVLRVQLTTGNRTMVSGCPAEAEQGGCTGTSTDGDVPQPFSPQAVVVTGDGALVVAEQSLPGIVRVDSANGNRTLMSGCRQRDTRDRACLDPVGSGPDWLSPDALTVAPDGTLFVLDAQMPAVVRVDPLNGDRTVVSGCSAFYERTCIASLGSGVVFTFPRALAMAADGALLVLDGEGEWSTRVVRVDPQSGERTLVTGPDRGTGPALHATALAIESAQAFVVADSFLGAILRIDVASGDRTILSGCTAMTCDVLVGNGPPLAFPTALLTMPDGSLLVGDAALNAVVHIDPGTGDRTVLAH
jgi:streptogramin lyase